jgi:hypothetical protein
VHRLHGLGDFKPGRLVLFPKVHRRVAPRPHLLPREHLLRNNEHAFAGLLNSFTHLRALLVLHDRGIF